MGQLQATASSIREFWDDRARKFGADGKATLRETHLREVEVRTMMRKIAGLRPARVLDVGCGNGWSTKQYAAAFPDTQFAGIDFSAEMVRHALTGAPVNCTFAQGDVLEASTIGQGTFDLVMTQRCIQNLANWELQKRAIANLLARRSAGGVLMMMECSKDGVAQLNGVRQFLGLTPIEGIEPWHNAFIRDANLVAEFGAAIEYFASTYMFLAKVVHKRLSYVARYLPAFGRFGYDRLYVMR